jgi:hypothetical protein
MAKAGTCLDSYAGCSEIGTYGGADFFPHRSLGKQRRCDELIQVNEPLLPGAQTKLSHHNPWEMLRIQQKVRKY